jgi:hypothetical protein
MTEQTQDTSITLNDIALVVQLIDVASTRGAIRGKEMSAIGNLRERFVAFLTANQPAKAPVPEATEEAAAE